MRFLELLLKLATPRGLLIVLIVAAVPAIALRFQRVPLSLYNGWRYTPAAQSSPGGGEILERLERERARQVESQYRRVLSAIERARARGSAVKGLSEKAASALRLNGPASRAAAARMLSEVEMAIPVESPRAVPLDPSDESEDIAPDIAPFPAAGQGRKRRIR